jgi:hypothetical protein
MQYVKALASVSRVLLLDLIRLIAEVFRSRTSLAAENLFLRKQLAYYQEHKVRPQPLSDAARFSLVVCDLLRPKAPFKSHSAPRPPQTPAASS